MLDQRNEFQKDIARIKENSRISNLESYAVHGVLVIGTTPDGLDPQKSFELFRGNSKDITIITFDELLAKLKSGWVNYLKTVDPCSGCPQPDWLAQGSPTRRKILSLTKIRHLHSES